MFGEEETQRRIECIVGTVRHLDQIRGRAVLADFLAERADETTQRGGGGPGVDVVNRFRCARYQQRSEEHTSELQSLMRISYAVFCLKKKTKVQEPDNTALHRT